MLRILLAYGIAALVMLALDVVWLTTMVGMLYAPIMGDLMRPKPDMVAAVAFYVLYIFGLVWLVIRPALVHGVRWGSVAMASGLFGLVAYGTYDLTAQAVIVGWSWKLTVIDMIWGTFLTMTTGLCTVFLLKVMGQAKSA
ncbi:DUF2177 family protein [Asticcacaulis sp. AC402]|uniref:DUF2177 family protein n=1 Tax=Asticcacaulis sp. AC402 TaxID=1282361 RepID=UPI0003C3B4DB|nr:DUF2177 family protein [Asticcacaulis sp. AC402]ESQ75738.1 hypothetical protein ABAC402_07170 [Asticcacaulis sp. AC402]